MSLAALKGLPQISQMAQIDHGAHGGTEDEQE